MIVRLIIKRICSLHFWHVAHRVGVCLLHSFFVPTDMLSDHWMNCVWISLKHFIIVSCFVDMRSSQYFMTAYILIFLFKIAHYFRINFCISGMTGWSSQRPGTITSMWQIRWLCAISRHFIANRGQFSSTVMVRMIITIIQLSCFISSAERVSFLIRHLLQNHITFELLMWPEPWVVLAIYFSRQCDFALFLSLNSWGISIICAEINWVWVNHRSKLAA